MVAGLPVAAREKTRADALVTSAGAVAGVRTMADLRGQKLRGVFLIPFYDRDLVGLVDAIASIRHYVKEPHAIVCVNDCRGEEANARAERILEGAGAMDFRPAREASWPTNTYGALFCKKYQALEFIAQRYDFDYLVAMDTDALVSGSELFARLDERAGACGRSAGMFGSYRWRTDGKKRTRRWWALYMLWRMYVSGRSDFAWLRGAVVPAARCNGYRLGEHVLGGAFVLTVPLVLEMTRRYPYELLARHRMPFVDLGDDVLFSAFTLASGFSIADFGRPCDPLAIALDFLPVQKEKVAPSGKQLIHSLKKGFRGEDEATLRRYFYDHRT